MTIIVDTRQKEDKHKGKHEQMVSLGAKLIRSKLPIGDYALLTDLSTVIDTKQDLQEVYGNIISDHKRYVKEIKKAQDNGIHLIFLVEHGKGIGSIDDVKDWKNPRIEKYKSKIKSSLVRLKLVSKFESYEIEELITIAKTNDIDAPKPPVSSKQLATAMRTLSERYGCKFLFCAKEDCGKQIVELLGGESLDQG